MASDEGQKATRKTGARRPLAQPNEGRLGDALRTVYEQTVSETIPSEMLDLLGKLD